MISDCDRIDFDTTFNLIFDASVHLGHRIERMFSNYEELNNE